MFAIRWLLPILLFIPGIGLALNPMDDPNLAPRSPSSSTTNEDNQDIASIYQKQVKQDIEVLRKYQSQLQRMSHPACSDGKFSSFSMCFRAMVATHPIKSMEAFEIFNLLATAATNLDDDKTSDSIQSEAEEEMHQILVDLNYVENQIFIIEKVNPNDLLVNRMQLKTQDDSDTMKTIKASEKQRYIAFWYNAHKVIKKKFDSVYKGLKKSRRPSGGKLSPSVKKYKDLLNRYRAVHKGAIKKAYPR